MNSRDRWASALVWLWLVVPAVAWGWLTWIVWTLSALNVAFVFVIAIGLSWAIILLALIPAHACRQLMIDRTTGALELILCTPVTVESIARGIWLSLRRHFLLPLSVVLLIGTLLTISGYMTFGFGGMLDPNERARWLFAWSTGIIFLPLTFVAISWVAMRRTLFARNQGEASAVAFLQVLGALAFVLWFLYWFLYLLAGHSNSPIRAAILVMAAFLTLLAFMLTARRQFLQNLRPSAASAFTEMEKTTLSARVWLRLASLIKVKETAGFCRRSI